MYMFVCVIDNMCVLSALVSGCRCSFLVRMGLDSFVCVYLLACDCTCLHAVVLVRICLFILAFDE